MRPTKGYLRHKLAGHPSGAGNSTDSGISTESSSKIEGSAILTRQDESLAQYDFELQKQQQQALQRSFPFHTSDMTGLDPESFEPAISFVEACPSVQPTKMPLGLSSNANIGQGAGPGAAANKIRLDPVLQMAYFDTAQSRRAFSLMRTGYETSPEVLGCNSYSNSYGGSNYANTYSNCYGNSHGGDSYGNSSGNGQDGLVSQTEKRNRTTTQKRKRRNSLRRIVKFSRVSTAAPTISTTTATTSTTSSTGTATATARSSGSSSSAPSSSTPNSYLSPVKAKPILRSKVNTNSAAEMERLMVLSEERRQRLVPRSGPGLDSGRGFGNGKSDGFGSVAGGRGARVSAKSIRSGHGQEKEEEEEEDEEEEDAMAAHLQNRQYPRGTRTSVKELYSAMRMAQVEGYEKRM